MKILNMFAEDITRRINGVIKVDQGTADDIEQEVREYVITRELKKHFARFFKDYTEALKTPTADIGVWISGFFGSGKSHFLKMLSYLLENRLVNGLKTVEYFREKLLEDPDTFWYIEQATKRETETILFNVDIEGSMKKDKTAILRVFAKMFYNHRGFLGKELKVALFEQYIDQAGKTEAFRKAIEEKKGIPWTELRGAFAFHGKVIVPALMEVLDMSEEDAKSWFNDHRSVEFSIAQLVEDIKTYVDSKPKDFRLLFLVDEVGQYIGADTDLLLNLQSLIEKLGSECRGKVWVLCTGQEAIDEIIKVRADEFSRIQARFKTRLSLTSSSVDEVIQKRILKKKPEVATELEALYARNDSVLRNLFAFNGARQDVKGYSGAGEFAVNFPFVPYQFKIMQKVFAEIRKHGNSGKHLSGGERSMLSGFQEAAQAIQESDEYALAPFYRFYDTVHSFLDSAISGVILRCEKAAEDGNGLEMRDVSVLKLLYLIRYIDQDIPGNLDNITILMADDIRTDKIKLRGEVSESLNRLLGQNYIGRTGDVYHFLTDEEQDIAREIKNTPVDTATIVSQISQMIFAEIYPARKYRYQKYDFAFDSMVDGCSSGTVTGGMKLTFLTVATDASQKSELQLMADSIKDQAIVVLADTPYFESLEKAMKIRRYVKQRNVSQLQESVQKIIQHQQDEASRYESSARAELKKAIETARFYVGGERLEPRGNDAKSKIDQALEYLVAHVYRELGRITKFAESDADILEILNGSAYTVPDTLPNPDAAADVLEYLEIQHSKNLPTSMADIQNRYQTKPYGWREIDIACVAARLVFEQKVTIKYAGMTILPNNPKLTEMLRKKSEVGKTGIQIREHIQASKIREVREFLREYFDKMDIPNDEDGLINFVVDNFTEQRKSYEKLQKRYERKEYPDFDLLVEAVALVENVLSQKKDNIALIDRVLQKQDALCDSKEALQGVEGFFNNQVTIFDTAVEMKYSLQNDLAYFQKDEELRQAFEQIQIITNIQTESRTIYKRIPELNVLMATVQAGHGQLLEVKRTELLEIVRQCMEAVHTTAGGDSASKAVVEESDRYFTQCKQQISEWPTLTLLDGLQQQMWTFKDKYVKKLEILKQPPKPVSPPPAPAPKPVKSAKPALQKRIKTVYRQAAFPARTLESLADVDDYVEKIRAELGALLKDWDGIKIN